MTDSRAPLDCDAVRDLAPLFVSGALGEVDADAVREHLAGCSDPHLELIELGEAATALLEVVEPVEPPARLKARLMEAAEADLREGRHASTAAPRSATAPRAAAPGSATGPRSATRSAPPQISLARERARRRPSVAWLAAAAAVVVAVGLGGWNLALRSQLGDAEAYRAGVGAALELASKPGSATALLVGESGAVSGLGVVGADGTVRLAVRGLPATSGGAVYAAWAIAGDGIPVNIAEFKVGADGTASAATAPLAAEPGVTLALTLEPRPGATAPSLPIVASGATRPAPG